MAFDVITPVRMCGSEVTTSPSFTTLRTTPTGSVDMVKNIDIANNGSGLAIVTLHLVPNGGAAGDDNVLLPAISVPKASVFQWSGIQNLNSDATIQANASITGVCITISGGNAT